MEAADAIAATSDAEGSASTETRWFQRAEAVLHVASAGAAEHGELVPTGSVLSVGDLPVLRAQSAAVSVLHAEAGALLNELTAGQQTASIDLQQRWPTWRQYLASHSQGNEIVGPGVVAITAGRIAGTSDPNRYGRERLDFFVRRMDGSAYQLHPGTKRAQDAKPVYISPVVFHHSVSME